MPHTTAGTVAGRQRALRFGGVLLAGLVFFALGAADPSGEDGYVYDPENARDIFEVCAGCHGKYAEGSGDGEYPRLAGLPERYVARQLRAFKARTRPNIPMYQYTTERELPESDVRDIARYLSELELPSRMPELDPTTSAYERLLIAQRVFQVPRAEGDVDRGQQLFEKSCRRCHGKEGWGKGRTPQLAGQYTDYLRRQIRRFRAGERKHRKMEKLIAPLGRRDLDDLFAYLSTRDD